MESEKISKPKLLWDGIKHITCAVWGEYTPIRRKEIKAEELEELCEMMSPSFSCFKKHLRKQGIKIDRKTQGQLFRAFYGTFDSLFPEEISGEEIDNLIEESYRILREANPYEKVADFSFLYSMVVDAETILARIKDKELEKHVVFYIHRSTPTLIETLGGAVKQFLTEKLNINPNDEYCEDGDVPWYMSKWSFLFNRRVVDASASVEIKNLKIIGSSRINFERFTCVVLSHNIFCDLIEIEATMHKRINNINAFIFSENIFYGYRIHFIGIHYLIFERNNFKEITSLRHFPNILGAPNNPVYQHGNIEPIVRLINNKTKKRLGIDSKKRSNDGDTASIKIEFLRGNQLAELYISTRDNELHQFGVKSSIESISFDEHEEIKPTDTDLNLLRQYKNFFLGLKNQAIKDKDRSAEFNYARKERYFDGRLSSRWEDKLVFKWSEIVSDSGISWVRPLGFLFILQVICIALPVWMMEDYEWGVRLAIETLNPLTTLSEGLPENLLPKHPYLIPTLTVFQKIYLSILLYETIKVLRRFSK